MYTIQYKKIDKELSVEENFVLALQEERNAKREFFKGINIYYHLFFMLKFHNEDFMHEVVTQYTEEGDWWFYNFHKQFRSYDMFDGVGFYDRRISEEDNARRTELLRLRDKRIKEFKPKYSEYKGRDNEEEYFQLEKDFYDNDEVLKEFRVELRKLNTWYNSYEMKENFGGNMDMVVWLTISNDNGVLYQFMDDFLAMYHGVESYESKRLFAEDVQQAMKQDKKRG